MSGSMVSGEATPPWQDRAIAKLATYFELDDDSKAIAKTALDALGQVLRDQRLYSPHIISEPTIVVGGRQFAVPLNGPEVPGAVIDQLASSPILRQYAEGRKLSGAGIQALLNNPAAVRAIFGSRLPILACMDVD
ncbi:hypothetical protein GFB56_15580 [Ensifer sp. T173]|uniref:Uncharacterized protein n=1 Tax=Ensifer canadensis TaxID=555315 RepID=A0AAW4FM01_9HYPH|nr:hypothetical protein [Ensifer canadensis]MBM3092226.1 hypothetical protein [Ensifer canadensis]UBI73950.1 hypothetical protein J3R84_10465 [Ensifer canadensis]